MNPRLGPIALTMGEPAGVGPEITLAAWRKHREGIAPRFFVIGEPALYAGVDVKTALINSPGEAWDTGDDLPVVPLALPSLPVPGTPDAANAGIVIRCIEQATEWALAGAVPAIVTNPIAKATLYNAGFKHQGHTDFLGALTATAPHSMPRGPVMMLMAGDLRVALVTEHLSLKNAAEALTTKAIVHTASVVAMALKQDFGIVRPRLAIAALNPHAGESGALGSEEIQIIKPAADYLKAQGMDVRGPLPADTLFHPEARAKTDAVICMHHDQGLIPVKMLDFWGGVNVTLGLPIVRTSPDHGTGFEIAGKGVARADSLLAALKSAAEIAKRRAAS